MKLKMIYILPVVFLSFGASADEFSEIESMVKSSKQMTCENHRAGGGNTSWNYDGKKIDWVIGKTRYVFGVNDKNVKKKEGADSFIIDVEFLGKVYGDLDKKESIVWVGDEKVTFTCY